MGSVLKRIGFTLLIILIFSAMVVFTAGNPGEVNLKLLHWEINSPVPLAFTVVFAIGWSFGVVCMGLYAFKVTNERRMLRRSLRIFQHEFISLERLPSSTSD